MVNRRSKGEEGAYLPVSTFSWAGISLVARSPRGSRTWRLCFAFFCWFSLSEARRRARASPDWAWLNRHPGRTCSGAVCRERSLGPRRRSGKGEDEGCRSRWWRQISCLIIVAMSMRCWNTLMRWAVVLAVALHTAAIPTICHKRQWWWRVGTRNIDRQNDKHRQTDKETDKWPKK